MEPAFGCAPALLPLAFAGGRCELAVGGGGHELEVPAAAVAVELEAGAVLEVVAEQVVEEAAAVAVGAVVGAVLCELGGCGGGAVGAVPAGAGSVRASAR